MAFSPKTLLTLAILLVLATSQAHGLVVAGVNVTTMVVNTGLHCQINPASLIFGNAAPLTNVSVGLVLNNITIANATTGMTGTSLMIVNTGSLLSTISDVLSLKVIINPPFAGCSIFANTTGTLQGPVQIVNLLNDVLNLVTTVLRPIA